MWKRDFLTASGGWDPKIRQNQDVELVLRCIIRGAQIAISRQGYSVWCDHDDEDRISKRVSADLLKSMIDFRYRLAIEAKVLGHGLPRDFAISIYSLARLAYFRGYFEVEEYALSTARALGLRGHHGTIGWILASSLLGMKAAESLARYSRRINAIIRAQLRIFTPLRLWIADRGK